MNSTTRTALRLLVATPIAVGAIAFGSATAHADGIPAGPGVIVAPPPSGDPTPDGPGEIANPEPKPEPKPQGPGDIANPEPKPDPHPHGPGDIALPDPQDKPGQPEDQPEEQDQPAGPKHHPADAPEPKAPVAEPKVVEVADQADVDVPSRIDAGAGSARAADDEDGAELAWLLAGGGALTAAGAVLARQRRVRRTR